jgi:plastocyanin
MAGAAGVLLLATVGIPQRPARAANIDIGALGSNQFAPNDVAAVVGDQVTFTNGGGTHSAVSVAGGYPPIPLGGGQSGSWQLGAPGTVWFYCGVHATAGQANEQGLASGAMVGRIVVSQPSPTATPILPTATPSPTATLTGPTAAPAAATTTATMSPTESPATTSTRTTTATAAATRASAGTTTPLPPDASDDPEDDDGSGGPLMGFVAGGLALAAVGGGVFLALRLRAAA